ncbi:MAG: DUF3102 domain-containing protein [Planctomycetota bacterium]|nr:DUF3102 domain-containing protein [Planctomycetota bacterium]
MTTAMTPLPQLGKDIRTALATVRRCFGEGLEAARVVGAMLTEAKEQVAHGEWEKWLATETDLSARKARRYMEFYRLAVDAPHADLKCLQPIWDQVQGNSGRAKSDVHVRFADEDQDVDAGDETVTADEKERARRHRERAARKRDRVQRELARMRQTGDEEEEGEVNVELEQVDDRHLGPCPETDAEFETAVDADGRPIPQHLDHAFEIAEQIKHIAREVTNLRTTIEQSTEAEPMAWSQIGTQDAVAKLKLVAEGLRLGCPHVVCCYCGGEDSEKCQGCKGTGFLSKTRARCVPKELRPAEEGDAE